MKGTSAGASNLPQFPALVGKASEEQIFGQKSGKKKVFLNSQVWGSSQGDTTEGHSAPSWGCDFQLFQPFFPAFPALLSAPSVTQTLLQPLKCRADLTGQIQKGWSWPWIPQAEEIKLIHVFLIKTFNLWEPVSSEKLIKRLRAAGLLNYTWI